MITRLNNLYPLNGILLPTNLTTIFLDGTTIYKENFIKIDYDLFEKRVDFSASGKFGRFVLYTIDAHLEVANELKETFDIEDDFYLIYMEEKRTMNDILKSKELKTYIVNELQIKLSIKFHSSLIRDLSNLSFWLDIEQY